MREKQQGSYRGFDSHSAHRGRESPGRKTSRRPNQQKLTPQQISADKDLGKVSADGAKGLQDLSLARLAIYDGRVDDAKKFIAEAVTAFNKAKADETVFNKAESALKPPVAKDAAENKSAASAKPADASKATQMEKPIAWLPVDGSIVIDEDYTAKTAKTAAVADTAETPSGRPLQNGRHRLEGGHAGRLRK